MIEDIVADKGMLFLGTRLKRLGERLQADVTRIIGAAGLSVQPAQYPLLAALAEHGTLSIGDLVEATGISQPGITRTLASLHAEGLTEPVPPGRDRRIKTVRLTASGQALVAESKQTVWPQVRAAADSVCAGTNILATLTKLEAALARRPLHQRTSPAPGLRLRPFEPALAADFAEISREWVSEMFTLEPADLEAMADPHARFIATGGDVLFAEAEGLGIIGTVALLKTGDAQFELTKMGVRAHARGLRAGAFLMREAITRARTLGARRLYLLTTQKNTAAINLYEKSGFVHDPEILRDHGARFARCDVAMRYAGDLG